MNLLQVNFVGKLLGPQGSTIKRLQEDTGAKISVLGKGSMRDKNKVCLTVSFASVLLPCITPLAIEFCALIVFRRKNLERGVKLNMLTSPWSCMCSSR